MLFTIHAFTYGVGDSVVRTIPFPHCLFCYILSHGTNHTNHTRLLLNIQWIFFGVGLVSMNNNVIITTFPNTCAISHFTLRKKSVIFLYKFRTAMFQWIWHLFLSIYIKFAHQRFKDTVLFALHFQSWFPWYSDTAFPNEIIKKITHETLNWKLFFKKFYERQVGNDLIEWHTISVSYKTMFMFHILFINSVHKYRPLFR